MLNSRYHLLTLLDDSILGLSLLYVLLLIWMNFMPTKILLLLTCLILFRLFYPMKLRKPSMRLCILAFICGFLFLRAAIVARSVYTSNNIKIIVQNALILIYFAYMRRNREAFTRNYLNKAFTVLNIYYFLNLIIMSIQISHPGFMMASTTNTATWDQITGLIGPDGTHCVTLFFCFIFILNLNHIMEMTNRSKKRLLVMYQLVITFWSIIISTQNDNGSLFLLLPLVLIVYFIFRMPDRALKVIKNIWKPVLVIVILIVSFNFIMTTDMAMFEKLQRRFNQTVGTYYVAGRLTLGTDERSYYFLEALNHGGMLGCGWGSITMFSEKSIISLFGKDFASHFGMAAIQPIIYMGGWLFFILYAVFIVAMFCEKNNYNLLKQLSLSAFIILVAYYTQILVIVRHTIFLSLLLTVILLIPEKAHPKIRRCESEKNRNSNLYLWR